jgi:hypothetical protein
VVASLTAAVILLGAFVVMFGLFFFLTLFMEDVWGYSALRTGVAYLPMVTMIMALASSQLVARIGVRPVVLAASAISAGGMLWLSRITEHSSYAGCLLGPTLLTGAGLGLLFTPLTLTSLSKVDNADAGLASSLINTGQVRVGPGQHLGPCAGGRVLPGVRGIGPIMVLALVLAAVIIRVTRLALAGAQS